MCLHLVFLGTHDEVQRWIQNKKNRRIDPPGEYLAMIDAGVVQKSSADAPRPRPMLAQSDFEDLSVVPDDRLLRRIFCGLAGCGAEGDDR